jgi:hypothetical protein
MIPLLLSACGGNPVTSTPEGKRIDEILNRDFEGRPYSVQRWWAPRQDDALWKSVDDQLTAEFERGREEYKKLQKFDSPDVADARKELRSLMSDEEKLKDLEKQRERIEKAGDDFDRVKQLEAVASELRARTKTWDAQKPLRFCRLKFRCEDKTGVQQDYDMIFVVRDGEWKVGDDFTKSTLLENGDWN